MGPVSFESLDGGATRSEALTSAARLTDAGVRVVQVTEAELSGPGAGEARFRLVVRSADAVRAREILAAHA